MYWPYVVLVVLLVVFMGMSIRNRKRQAAEEAQRADRIDVGTEVMTTSGLYGTVVAKHEDGTAVLSIAPGVEVKWALAALRDAASLTQNYRRGLDPDQANTAAATEPDVELRKSDDGS